MLESQLFQSGQYIDGQWLSSGDERFRAKDPRTGDALDGEYVVATLAEIDKAATAATSAFGAFATSSGESRAQLLEAIASEIEALGPTLIERAMAESGLPQARLEGERGRTCGQLRLFANLVREGSWVDARIDSADPTRAPAPKPDLRRMLRPIGPVAVFGASNFPLAFSVAGGDTASALAAGCPVVVKAHPAHPGTSALVAGAIAKAIDGVGAAKGVFQMVHGFADAGSALVVHPEMRAVGFTGSQAAGLALWRLANARPVLIPVFAEMGSVNPIFVSGNALDARGEAIATGYAASLTMGVGQFCTNPGLVFLVDRPNARAWIETVRDKLAAMAPGTMLTESIGATYCERVGLLASNPALKTELLGNGSGAPALFSGRWSDLKDSHDWRQEVFGPCGIVALCDDHAQLVEVASALEGQLTATIHCEPGDDAGPAAQALEARVGRLVYNGFPTGVEVGHAMQHGGPFPATTDARFTSVGSAAILRWARPVCYQDAPENMLPPELHAANPLGIERLIDGVRTRDALTTPA